ncbi:SRPBCC domain-containing protein [Actinoplanes sp. NPDC026619]|uniref:SRPBCC domain-containing protein n=1 Tax=Actinoplanes sp. NPDC026619 TaxID=3155798 RepID=UPI0033C19188
MKITNEFTVHTPIDRAWQVLTDLEGIAPCMPGAQLTGVDGDVYQGKVKVKVGPVISDFAGTARFTEKDDGAYRAVIDAKGRDARSAGNASALVTAVLSPSGESTTVSVDTDLKISGKLAQFGSGMIKEVSGKLLAQFVTNLEAMLATDAGTPEPAPTPGAADSPVPAGTPEPAAAPGAADAPVPAGSSAAGAVGGLSAAAAVGGLSAAAAVGGLSAAAAVGGPSEAGAVGGPSEAGAVGGAVPVAPSAAAVATAPEIATSPAPVSAVPSSPATPAADAPVSATAASALPHPAGGAEPVVSTADPEASPAAGFLADAADPGPWAPVRSAVDEPEPLDLLSIAGGSIYKRVVPVAVGVVVVGAVIAWLVARR